MSATACSDRWSTRANAALLPHLRPLNASSIMEPEPLAKSTSDSPSLAPNRKIDGPVPPETHIELTFDDNRAVSALVGQYGQHLALLERRLNVLADSRGNLITVAGSRDGCEAARWVLEGLYARAL